MLHAFWNLLLAGSRDPEATTAVALPVSAILCAPFAAIWWELDAAAIPFVAASSALELAYFALLATAYRRAELSLVYPLSRGLAPVLVLLGAVVVTGAATSAAQIVGILLVAAGVLLVRGVRRGRGTLLALTIACCIASYTVVDKAGLEHASPLTYLELVTLIPGVAYAAGFLATRGVAPIRAALVPRSVIAGLASFAAYGMVLTALTLAPAAPVAAVRESSVLVATALAAWFLKEHVTRRRLAGAALVVGGIALLSL